MGPFIPLALMTSLLLPLHAWAATPTITCHCFTERTYNPDNPTVADPYFLAATQNSFMAALFGVEKKQIVLKKQQGTPGDDLWIACWLATRTDSDPDALLQERKAKGSWKGVLSAKGIGAAAMGQRLAGALAADATDAKLAAALVDDLLLRFRFHGEQDLKALRKAGADNRELILLGLIAPKTGRTAMQLFSDVRGGGTSWGALLQRARIEPKAIQAAVAARIAPTRDTLMK